MAETRRTLLERIDQRTAAQDLRLGRLESSLSAAVAQINSLGGQLTMANAALTALAQQLNDETNAIQARIDRLTTSLQDVATPEQIAELTAISSRLAVLGQDPTNPIPTP